MNKKVINSKTGEYLTQEELNTQKYFLDQVSTTTQFSKSMKTIFKNGPNILLDVGFKSFLNPFGQTLLQKYSKVRVLWLDSFSGQCDKNEENFIKTYQKLITAKGVFFQRKQFPWQELPHPLLQKKSTHTKDKITYTAKIHENIRKTWLDDHFIPD
jgi:acyl transferase domain-containing protein